MKPKEQNQVEEVTRLEKLVFAIRQCVDAREFATRGDCERYIYQLAKEQLDDPAAWEAE